MSLLKAIILALLLRNSSVQSASLNDYCSLHCGPKSNAVCELAPCKLSLSCGVHAKMQIMTNGDRKEILDLLNGERQKFAKGLHKIASTGVANMHALSYSFELEFTAQCWTNNCNIIHADCISTPRYKSVSQCIHAESTEYPLLFTDTIKYWTNETVLLTDQEINRYDFKKNIHHITQVLWAKAQYVGCGRTKFSKTIFFACNFSPTQVRGEPVFIRGKACSKCPVCNGIYDGLCGIIEKDTEFEPPFELEGSGLKANIKITCVLLLVSYYNKKLFS